MSELALNLFNSLRNEQPERQVEIEISPNLVVHGDPALLRVMLENLTHNAWKFTSLRPLAKITFGSEQVDGEQRFFIRDNGAGFNPEYSEKLFKPFQRLHGHHEYPGAGIGLATIHRIVQRHGGRVWAKSAVDQGTTIYFVL